ncbi:MAG: DUF5682 family protein [Thermosynechococcaceae cyanobacterium MS004]|nr:DUF5682 family protein [Thermosynechococcaceae cyanobacterium MS004]
MATDSNLHLFGVRHHGPGSARSLLESLQALQPDVLLIEGPPEAESILPLLLQTQMQPPVAMLLYVPDTPHLATYYPLASFSPEWQALQFGLRQQIPIRFMDLPQSHQLIELAEPPAEKEIEVETTDSDRPEGLISQDLTTTPELEIRRDPLRWLAQAAGYSDGERWWEQFVEQRQDSTDVFSGILEAMTALRTEVELQYPPNVENPRDHREALREAYMRQTIRQVQKEGFTKIAVICGAWHAPALVPPLAAAKADAALLKGLPKAKVSATWVPWTYERLTYQSGYGAGVESPGWYEHLWEVSESLASQQKSAPRIRPSERWLVKIARLLRTKDLDASSASVIEAVRMAEALAALRDHTAPGLTELNEAVQSVLCFGDATPMQLIQRQLMVGDRLGTVPDETPMVPLQQDLRHLQQRLRLKPEALDKALVLDLRKEMDLGRSLLLHRLKLLNISWGEITEVSGKGTFKEKWILRWRPELEIALIEAGRWGNTIETAATAFACDQATQSTQLPPLTALLEQVLLATLSAAVCHVMQRLQAEAAIASDLIHLMAAIPPLANVLRYSDVRQTDVGTLTHVVDGLMARICIGLPSACASLDDDAADQMLGYMVQTHHAIKLLQEECHYHEWMAVLVRLMNQAQLHGLLAGRCCRLLLDEGQIKGTEAAQSLNLALSRAVEPAHGAVWIEGFLQGSGLLLLHDKEIWSVLDQWITELPAEDFIALLPLLRRTFAAFTAAERRQMAQRVKHGAIENKTRTVTNLDGDRASLALPLVAQLLGLDFTS